MNKTDNIFGGIGCVVGALGANAGPRSKERLPHQKNEQQ